MRHRCDCGEDLNGDSRAKVALGPGGGLLCHALFTSIVHSPVDGRATTTLIWREFSFCILIGRAYWCTKGIDRVYLFISPFFLLLCHVCPEYRYVFASPPIFKLCICFLMGTWTRGRTGHLIVFWADEYLSDALRAKREPCCGKVNKCVIWQFPPVLPVSLRIVFKGLESEPAASMETRAVTWNSPSPHLAASLPEAVPVWLALGAGTLRTSAVVTLFPPLRILLAMWKSP